MAFGAGAASDSPPPHGREGLLKLYTKIAADYPIISVEDPFDQDDWENTTKFTAEGVCQARCDKSPPSGVLA